MEGKDATWLVLVGVICLVVGGLAGAAWFPETVTETVEVEVPGEAVETIVEVPGPEVEVEVEVPAEYVLVEGEDEELEEWFPQDILDLQDDLADKLDLWGLFDLAVEDFEDELGDYDECEGEDYRESEIEVEDIDDVELFATELDDEDDTEYEVSFEAELEYDNEATCFWDVTVSYDDEGDVEVDADLIV
jgi:hypothetical protein|tara:strand:+ start:9744 stop:10313 length:570 start_codon:yes stop_codon:yes gene_type:complete